ncbi:unnamed protein product [Amoebophrya sp. A120]|nr:unnamed protein product [Amoebophrya sp. A120]|eukprot:GSA120T00020206001.1
MVCGGFPRKMRLLRWVQLFFASSFWQLQLVWRSEDNVHAQLVPHIIHFEDRPDLNTTNALSRLRWFVRHRRPQALQCDPLNAELRNDILTKYGTTYQNALGGGPNENGPISPYGVYLAEMQRYFDSSHFSQKLSVLQNFFLVNSAHFEKFCRPIAFLSQVFKVIGLSQYYHIQTKAALELMDAETWYRVQQTFNTIAELFMETEPEQAFFHEMSAVAAEDDPSRTDLLRLPRQLAYTLHPSSMAGMRRMFLVLSESPYLEVKNILPPLMLQAYGRFIEIRQNLMRIFTVHHPQWVYHVLPLDNMQLTIQNKAIAGDECMDRTSTMFDYEKEQSVNFYRLFRDGVAELLGKVADVDEMDATVARAMRLKSQSEYERIEREATGELPKENNKADAMNTDAASVESRVLGGGEDGTNGQKDVADSDRDGESASSAGAAKKPDINRMTHYLLMTDPNFTFNACTPAVMLALLVYINKLFEEAIQAMLRNEPLAAWSHFLKYSHHLINRVYLPARNKYAIPNWHTWIAGGRNIDWIGLIRVAENRMMSKKEILYGQKINRVEERADVCSAEDACKTDIVPEEYDQQMEKVFHIIVDELERLGLEFWPAGGTMIGALRWGKIAGRLTDAAGGVNSRDTAEAANNERWDVIDDDLEFMIGLHSEDAWLDVSAELSQVLTAQKGAGMCHQTFSLHTNNNFWSNYVRQDLLACGWYKPYAIGVELRSYVIERRLNFAYLFKMGGSGYAPWCDADQYAAKKEYQNWMHKDAKQRRLSASRSELAAAHHEVLHGTALEEGKEVPERTDGEKEEVKTKYAKMQEDVEVEARQKVVQAEIEARHGRGVKIFGFNPWALRRGTGGITRVVEKLKSSRFVFQKSRRKRIRLSSLAEYQATSSEIATSSAGAGSSKGSTARVSPPVNPLCYLGKMPVFQAWEGFLPLEEYLYPLKKCTLFDRTISCPNHAIDILKKFNANEYQNPGFCLALPYLAGRNLHRDKRMKNLEFDAFNEQDYERVYQKSLELQSEGFTSFAELFRDLRIEGGSQDVEQVGEKRKELLCDGNSFKDLQQRAVDHLRMCPPVRAQHGMEDYEDDFHF